MTAPCPHCGGQAAGDVCGGCGAPLTAAARAAKVAAQAPRPRPVPVDEPEAPMLIERARTTGGVAVSGRGAPDPEVEHAARARAKGAAAYLALQPSEAAVLAAASRIFAAWIAAGKVTDDNERELADRAVKTATRMALVTDRYLQADAEDW